MELDVSTNGDGHGCRIGCGMSTVNTSLSVITLSFVSMSVFFLGFFLGVSSSITFLVVPTSDDPTLFFLGFFLGVSSIKISQFSPSNSLRVSSQNSQEYWRHP